MTSDQAGVLNHAIRDWKSFNSFISSRRAACVRSLEIESDPKLIYLLQGKIAEDRYLEGLESLVTSTLSK